MDCYRLEDQEEDLGFEEYFEDQAITVIEWSQFIKDLLPPQHLIINIKVKNENERVLTIESHGDHYDMMKEVLVNELSTH